MMAKKTCSEDVYQRLCRCVTAYELPTKVPAPMAELVPLCGNDKKRASASLRFIVCQHIGKAEIRSMPFTEFAAFGWEGRQAWNVAITPALLEGTLACACLQEHGAPHADLCSAGGGHLRHPRRRQLAGYYGDHGRTGSTGCFVPNRGKTVTVCGIGGKAASAAAEMDCCESGSTLRFLIPVAAALGVENHIFWVGDGCPSVR